MDEEMSAYLGVFLYEADEQLKIMEDEILKLELGSAEQETIEAIFRAAHTLKGSSGAMGIGPINKLTHQLENVFDLLRRHKLKADTLLINTILEAVDQLKQMKESIVLESDVCEADASLLEKLERIAAPLPESTLQFDVSSNDEQHQEQWEERAMNELVRLDEYQENIVNAALNTNQNVVAIFIQLTQLAMMKSVRALLIRNNLKEVGEIVAAFPTDQEIEDEALFSGSLVYLLITQNTRQQIFHIINQISDIETVNLTLITKQNLSQFGHTPRQSKEEIEFEPIEQQPALGSKPGGKQKVNQTVRVDIGRLELLLNLVGELIIDQTRLTGVRNQLMEQYESTPELEDLSEISTHLSRVVSELQEGMMKTRMFPIEQLFNRFPRMIRDLSQRSNKQVELVMDGMETELDRSLIEEIGDPIIHLLRNCVDHGIETAGERVRRGKPPKGKIVLMAEHEENHIVITISDDGKGIDIEKLKRTAIEKGIIDAETASKLDARDALHLILVPGFSTAEQVTDISGRGVGMDIVKSHIEQLNGMIDIRTNLGEGTAFTIKLPLTLAVNRSLLVQIGSRTFAIPLSNVVEIIRMSTDNVNTAGNREVAVVRGKVIPLIRLHHRLGEDQPPIGNRTDIVVVGLAEKRIALAVDRTIGNQEIVIKSLGSFIGKVPYVAGATIMGDGGLILILDMNTIIREDGTSLTNDNDLDSRKLVENNGQFVTFWLGAEHFAVDIQKVQSIIEPSRITPMVHASSEVLGVINLRGDIIPVIDAHRRLGLAGVEKTKMSRIMIMDLGSRTAGVLVDQVTQVIKIPIDRIEAVRDRTINLNTQFVQGIYHQDNLIITVLDIEQVLTFVENFEGELR